MGYRIRRSLPPGAEARPVESGPAPCRQAEIGIPGLMVADSVMVRM